MALLQITSILSDNPARKVSNEISRREGCKQGGIAKILDEKTRVIYLGTGEQVRYNDLLKRRVDVDFVVRFERKNDSHTISNKTFDFSKTTIRQLIQDGYKETKQQMKEVITRIRREFSGT